MGTSARTIAFAVVLGVVCALLLAGATILTAPYRAANEKAEERRNFLGVVGAPVKDATDAQALVAMFDRDIRESKLGALTIYEYRPASSNADKPVAVAIPFAGMGLWGEIKGVIALEPDLKTIRGISFYKQDETPGLGGEIGSEQFQKQFVNKQIVSESGAPGFRILKPGATPGMNEVDGISGASLTGDRVQLILTTLATSIDKERSAYVR